MSSRGYKLIEIVTSDAVINFSSDRKILDIYDRYDMEDLYASLNSDGSGIAILSKISFENTEQEIDRLISISTNESSILELKQMKERVKEILSMFDEDSNYLEIYCY